MPDEQVRLYQAFAWDCPNCGKQNFCNGVPVENPDVQKQLSEIFQKQPQNIDGLDVEVQGEWVSVPDEVACSECSSSYQTVDDDEDLDEPWLNN